MPKIFRLVIPVLVFFLSACSFSLAEDVVPPAGSEQQQMEAQPSQVVVSGPLYPMVDPNPANGADVYAEKCQPCHGNKGLGDGPVSSRSAVPVAPIGTSAVARSSIPAEWYTLLTKGDLERGMPPFNSLSDRQKWDVIAYVYQLGMSAEELTLGKELYIENCERCHGEAGKGDGPDAARLQSDPGDFSSQEKMAGVSEEMMFQTISNGAGEAMPAFADKLTDNERWALTAYLRNFTFQIMDNGSDLEEAAGAYPEPEGVSQAYPEPTIETGSSEITPTQVGVGSVRVELVSTSGKTVDSGASVTLYGFDEMQNTYSETLTTGEQGIYVFENVEMPAGRAFIAGVDYAGGSYGSDVVVAEDSVSEVNLQVQVYESSTDASALTTDRVHIFFDVIEEGLIQVVEVFVISNPTDTAIVPAESGGPVASFLLPEAATDLQFQDGVLGGRYLEIPGGFADTMTVQPSTGEYQVVFAYNLPYDGKLDFSQTMSMDADAVIIMIPDNGLKLRGENISDDGTRDMQDTSYRLYSSAGLKSGEVLEFNLSGRPKTGSQAITTGSTQNIAIGLGAFGLALVGAGVWLFLRNRNQQAENGSFDPEGDEEHISSPELRDSAALMDAIIALDDLYRAGELPEEAYLKRRDELKTQLKLVMDDQG